MDPEEFEAIQQLLDKIADIVDQQLGSEELGRFLGELGTAVGKQVIASLNITVDVFDDDRESPLPLLTTGLSTSSGKEPYRTCGDSTPQRYIVEDSIQVVPHDRCPHCWEIWDFKLQNPSCLCCGTMMGDTCKLLLDTDECPWCNGGKGTVAQPRCDIIRGHFLAAKSMPSSSEYSWKRTEQCRLSILVDKAVEIIPRAPLDGQPLVVGEVAARVRVGRHARAA
jgi:hypothetical protein